MSTKAKTEPQSASFPLVAMVVMGLLGGLVVGFSFVIIQVWPLPPSVSPMLDFWGGFRWGIIVGGSFGLILGFLTDEQHFEQPA